MEGVGAINITENPVATIPTEFEDTLILGKDSQWATNSYGHDIRAIGGFWGCVFDILPGKNGLGYLEEYLLNGLGRHVESYSPNGKKIWEGQIVRMTLQLPGAKMEVDLRDMTNKAWIRYLTSEGGLIKRSTVFENADSQSKYGIKEAAVQGVIINSSAIADVMAEMYLNTYVNAIRPRPSIAPSGSVGSGGVRLSVFCQGYIRTLAWRVYNLMTEHSDQNLSLQISDIITAVGQFVNSTDIVENTLQVSQEYDRDDTAFDAIMGLVRSADASQNRYIAGMYEERKFKYEQVRASALSDVRYNFRIRDNEKVIRESGTGRVVPFSEIRANNYIRVSDIFTGKPFNGTDVNEDPQVTYIESISYQEPFGLDIQPDTISSLDTLMALSTFGGSSPV